jgi:hypothetical protein
VAIRQNRKAFGLTRQCHFDERAVVEGCEWWGHYDLPRLQTWMGSSCRKDSPQTETLLSPDQLRCLRSANSAKRRGSLSKMLRVRIAGMNGTYASTPARAAFLMPGFRQSVNKPARRQG